MPEGERDQAELERQLVGLTLRLSQLEARLAQVEDLSSAAAQAPQGRPQGWPTGKQPWPPQQTLPAYQWGQRQGWVTEPAPRQPAAPLPQPPRPQQPPMPEVTRPAASVSAAVSPGPAAPADPQPTLRAPGLAGAPASYVKQPASPRAAAAPSTGSGPAASAPMPARPVQAVGSDDLGFSLASFRDLESRLTGRLLAWVGAAAVVLGSVFFLSLAFSRGWIGPEGRVAMGIAGGTIFVGAGAWLFGRRQEQLGHVMVAVGLGVVSLSLFAGTRFYSLYSPEAALTGSFAAAVVAAAIAVRVKSEAVAIYGLLAIAAAPPLMGAGANSVTIAFLSLTVVGTTAIALVKSWRWLPPIAFAITAPQLVFWLSARPDASTAVVALAAYCLLHAIAATADELVKPLEAKLEEEAARSASLFFLNSCLAVGGGLWVLSGSYAPWQGAYIAAVALAHFAFGAYFVWKRSDLYPFGVFINAIGVAAVALAIERQFDGWPVAVGWAVAGLALAAIFGYRRHIYAGAAAAILGAMALAHLAVYEYPLLNWTLQGHTGTGRVPFADAAGLALACLLISGLLAAWFSRRRDVRIGVLIVGSVVIAYSLPFELSGPSLVAPWALEAALLVGVWRFHHNDYLGGTAAIIGTVALTHLGIYEYPGLNWSIQGSTGSGPFPFADSAGLTLAALLGAGLLAGLLSRSRDVRIGLLVVGSLLVAYSLPFEMNGTALVAAWASEVVGLAAIWGYRRNPYLALAAGVAAWLATVHFVMYEYSLGGWTLQGVAGPGRFAFDDLSGVALACLLVAGLAAASLSRSYGVRCATAMGGLLLICYSLPFELSGVALVAGWAVLVPIAIAAEGLLSRLPGTPQHRDALRKVPVVEMVKVDWADSLLLPAAAAAFLALAHMLAFEMPIATATAIVSPATPFVDLATLSAGIGITSFLLAAWITARPDLRIAAVVIATALAAYTAAFELALPFAVVAWCALAIAIGAWSFIPSYSRWTYITAAGVLVTASIVAILGPIAPVERLGVQFFVASTGEWFALHCLLAIGATCVTLAVGARYLPIGKAARSVLVLAGAIGLVYLASILLVDFFQGRVGGSTALEELQKQAQVSVSILWALIGMGIFMAGLIGWRQSVREGGLGLLALATAKVFLFDLSYLDVAYRVLSLIGLGLLLLVGAFAYQSLRPKRPTVDAGGEANDEANDEAEAPQVGAAVSPGD
ncbi:MAG TPA: DUF2339 domain-containing protein [Candidatus Limnocylindrales bacterium]